MMTLLHKFLKDEHGATAIEYAMIAALLGVVMIAALTSLDNSLAGIFMNVNSDL